jgi:hypothetical protein
MSRPTFGTNEPQRPTFGQPPARVSHHCIAPWGFACPAPGPHLPPAGPDPSTLAAFPELVPSPSVWTAAHEKEPRS